MILIEVENEEALLNPKEMFGYPEGTIFQQYVFGEPDNNYYVNCGYSEPLLCIWDAGSVYKLSHDTKKSLKELLPHVKVKKVDMVLNISLEKI